MASIIREAIDEKLMHDPDAERRRAAGRRLLAAPTPDDGREPDWQDVKHALLDDRYRKGAP